jgi:hypothetical protein
MALVTSASAAKPAAANHTEAKSFPPGPGFGNFIQHGGDAAHRRAAQARTDRPLRLGDAINQRVIAGGPAFGGSSQRGTVQVRGCRSINGNGIYGRAACVARSFRAINIALMRRAANGGARAHNPAVNRVRYRRFDPKRSYGGLQGPILRIETRPTRGDPSECPPVRFRQ